MVAPSGRRTTDHRTDDDRRSTESGVAKCKIDCIHPARGQHCGRAVEGEDPLIRLDITSDVSDVIRHSSSNISCCSTDIKQRPNGEVDGTRNIDINTDTVITEERRSSTSSGCSMMSEVGFRLPALNVQSSAPLPTSEESTITDNPRGLLSVGVGGRELPLSATLYQQWTVDPNCNKKTQAVHLFRGGGAEQESGFGQTDACSPIVKEQHSYRCRYSSGESVLKTMGSVERSERRRRPRRRDNDNCGTQGVGSAPFTGILRKPNREDDGRAEKSRLLSMLVSPPRRHSLVQQQQQQCNYTSFLYYPASFEDNNETMRGNDRYQERNCNNNSAHNNTDINNNSNINNNKVADTQPICNNNVSREYNNDDIKGYNNKNNSINNKSYVFLNTGMEATMKKRERRIIDDEDKEEEEEEEGGDNGESTHHCCSSLVLSNQQQHERQQQQHQQQKQQKEEGEEEEEEEEGSTPVVNYDEWRMGVVLINREAVDNNKNNRIDTYSDSRRMESVVQVNVTISTPDRRPIQHDAVELLLADNNKAVASTLPGDDSGATVFGECVTPRAQTRDVCESVADILSSTQKKPKRRFLFNRGLSRRQRKQQLLSGVGGNPAAEAPDGLDENVCLSSSTASSSAVSSQHLTITSCYSCKNETQRQRKQLLRRHLYGRCCGKDASFPSRKKFSSPSAAAGSIPPVFPRNAHLYDGSVPHGVHPHSAHDALLIRAIEEARRRYDAYASDSDAETTRKIGAKEEGVVVFKDPIQRVATTRPDDVPAPPEVTIAVTDEEESVDSGRSSPAEELADASNEPPHSSPSDLQYPAVGDMKLLHRHPDVPHLRITFSNKKLPPQSGERKMSADVTANIAEAPIVFKSSMNGATDGLFEKKRAASARRPRSRDGSPSSARKKTSVTKRIRSFLMLDLSDDDDDAFCGSRRHLSRRSASHAGNISGVDRRCFIDFLGSGRSATPTARRTAASSVRYDPVLRCQMEATYGSSDANVFTIPKASASCHATSTFAQSWRKVLRTFSVGDATAGGGKRGGKGEKPSAESLGAASGGVNGDLNREWEVVTVRELCRRLSLEDSFEPSEMPLPEGSQQSQLLDEFMIRQIVDILPPRAEGYPWVSIYNSDKHGFSLSTLYRKMSEWKEEMSPVLLIVRDVNSHVFGALASTALRPSDHYYGTGDSCLLFRFTGEFPHTRELRSYTWTGENQFFVNATRDFLSFGGGGGHYGLWLDADLNNGRSQRCATFDNEPLAGGNDASGGDFVVQFVEVFGFSMT